MGNVLWDEQGCGGLGGCSVEKTGAVTYRVQARGWDGEREVSPRRYLTTDQEMEIGRRT
jgi:hypothetical protein